MSDSTPSSIPVPRGARLRLPALAGVVGVLAGLSSAVFLVSLQWATVAFDTTSWLLYLLPLGGFAIGLAYHYGGGRSDEGNNLILAEIHEPRDWIPRRMAPMVLVGTIVTHLFGGSAGREGTAIQMSGSLTDGFTRLVGLRDEERRVLLVSAIAGGFGAVFGVPVAGAVFGLEVQSVGGLRRKAFLPAAVASVVGDLVVRGLGVHHTPTPAVVVDPTDPVLLMKVAIAGVGFGAAAAGFTCITHLVKRGFASTIRWVPARPLLGGALVVAATLMVGTRAYNGLSIGLIERSLAGGDVPSAAFAIKLAFTALTLGSGFVGGEVTPLFVIGATLGVTIGGVLDVPVPLIAAVGFVAVFAGAANAPLACTVMGVELFGFEPTLYLLMACAVAYVVSPREGIYHGNRPGRSPWLLGRPHRSARPSGREAP